MPSVVEEARKLRAASTHSRFSLYSVHTPSVRGIDRQPPVKAGVATVNSAANRMGVIMSAPFWLGLVGPKASRLLRIFRKGGVHEVGTVVLPPAPSSACQYYLTHGPCEPY